MKAHSRKLILPVLLFCAVFTTAQAHAALIAHYAFNGSLTPDSSGNGRTLSAGNSPTLGTPRFGSNSASFQSIDQDFLYIDDTVLHSFGTGDFAVSLWYQRTDSGTYDLIGNGTPDSIGGFPESGFNLRVSNANASPTLELFAGSTSVISTSPTLATADNSAFQHVLFQRENDEFQLYVNNGTAVTNTPVPDINLNTGLAFAIGARAKTNAGASDGTADHMNGLMDEIFIFDNALTPEQIEGLFTSNTFPNIGGGGGGSSSAIPEPSSLVLIALGAILALARRRRKR